MATVPVTNAEVMRRKHAQLRVQHALIKGELQRIERALTELQLLVGDLITWTLPPEPWADDTPAKSETRARARPKRHNARAPR